MPKRGKVKECKFVKEFMFVSRRGIAHASRIGPATRSYNACSYEVRLVPLKEFGKFNSKKASGYPVNYTTSLSVSEVAMYRKNFTECKRKYLKLLTVPGSVLHMACADGVYLRLKVTRDSIKETGDIVLKSLGAVSKTQEFAIQRNCCGIELRTFVNQVLEIGTYHVANLDGLLTDMGRCPAWVSTAKLLPMNPKKRPPEWANNLEVVNLLSELHATADTSIRLAANIVESNIADLKKKLRQLYRTMEAKRHLFQGTRSSAKVSVTKTV